MVALTGRCWWPQDRGGGIDPLLCTFRYGHDRRWHVGDHERVYGRGNLNLELEADRVLQHHEPDGDSGLE